MLTIKQLAQMIERLAQDAGGILFPEEGSDLFHRELWLLVAKRVSELRQERRAVSQTVAPPRIRRVRPPNTH